jgi:hypothetical protein
MRFAQATHAVQVLVAVAGVDHGAGAQEQQALEQRVREQVGERGRAAAGLDAGTEADEHQAELAARRVREHGLEVPLHARNRGREQAGDAAGPADDVQRFGWEQHEAARDQEHAGRDHRRRVDHRRRGGGALHRVGQPHVQRELRALADGAREDAERRDQQQPLARPAEERRVRRQDQPVEPFERQHVGVPGRMAERQQRADADQEAGVADAVADERLQLRVRRAQQVLEHAARAAALHALVVGVVAGGRLVRTRSRSAGSCRGRPVPSSRRS